MLMQEGVLFLSPLPHQRVSDFYSASESVLFLSPLPYHRVSDFYSASESVLFLSPLPHQRVSDFYSASESSYFYCLCHIKGFQISILHQKVPISIASATLKGFRFLFCIRKFLFLSPLPHQRVSDFYSA